MCRTMLFVVVCAWGTLPSFAETTTHELSGRLDAVTVYRGQALVTRVVEVPGPAGLHEVVVKDLPAQILPGSIYAESADGVDVRSVRYRVRPVAQDVRAEVRELDEKIAAKRDEIEGVTRRRQLLHDNWLYLNSIIAFTAPTATADLAHGVLDAGTLKNLSLFVFEQRRDISAQSLEADREKAALEGEVQLLQRERDILTGGSERTVREAVVFVDLRKADGGDLRVRYLVDDASWTPSYNVRAGTDSAMLEYNAAIQQRSGEDWTDVEMTLSTATPTLVGRAPKLEPLDISLSASAQPEDVMGYEQKLNVLRSQQRAVEMARNAPGRMAQPQAQSQQSIQVSDYWVSAQQSNDLNLNTVAAKMQVLDLEAAPRKAGRLQAAVTRDEGVSVTYRITGRTSLPSRSDRQMIQIAALDLPADFYKVATPVLTEFVYNEAELHNTSQRVLLAGPVMAFSGGEFVGHGDIPTVAAGERFAVGFGIDASLRATRELLDRNERISGGNRVVGFEYRLVVDNFGDAPAQVRLLDRLPKASKSEVQIALAENGAELCADRAYQQGPRKDGILRWDVDVPASAIGLDAFAINYEFELEYDRAKTITGLAAAN